MVLNELQTAVKDAYAELILNAPLSVPLHLITRTHNIHSLPPDEGYDLQEFFFVPATNVSLQLRVYSDFETLYSGAGNPDKKISAEAFGLLTTLEAIERIRTGARANADLAMAHTYMYLRRCIERQVSIHPEKEIIELAKQTYFYIDVASCERNINLRLVK
jgi:hypothetical protein